MLSDKWIILDFDGTMVDSLPLWREVDVDFLSKRGIEVPDDLLGIIEGMNLWDCAEYFKERFNLEEAEELIIEEWKFLIKEKYEKLPIKEDVLHLISEWEKPLAIASSSEIELIRSVLRAHHLEERFPSIVTSGEVQASKPEPHVYLEAARRLGVSPADCLVFEDTLAGVQGAKNAGMIAVAVYESMNDKWEQTKEEADFVLEHFWDWKEVVK